MLSKCMANQECTAINMVVHNSDAIWEDEESKKCPQEYTYLLSC
jgi:hypothetical protein